jgi:hypothetical protein
MIGRVQAPRSFSRLDSVFRAGVCYCDLNNRTSAPQQPILAGA